MCARDEWDVQFRTWGGSKKNRKARRLRMSRTKYEKKLNAHDDPGG